MTLRSLPRLLLVLIASLALAACEDPAVRPDAAGAAPGSATATPADEGSMSLAEARARARELAGAVRTVPRTLDDVRQAFAGLEPATLECAGAQDRAERERPALVAAIESGFADGKGPSRGQGAGAVRTADRLAAHGRLREALALLDLAGGRVAAAGGTAGTVRGDVVVQRQVRLMTVAARARLEALVGDAAGAERSRDVARDAILSGTGREDPLRAYEALAGAAAAAAAGRLAEAELRYREALAAADPEFALAGGIDRIRLATSLSTISLRQGQVLEAEAVARAALGEALARRSRTALVDRAGLPLTALAAALLAQGRLDDAEFAARQAVALFDRRCVWPGSQPSVAARRTLVRILAAAGDWAAIGAELRRTRASLSDDPEVFGRMFGADPEAWLAAVRAGGVAGGLAGLQELAEELAAERGAESDAALEARGFVGLARLAAGDTAAALEDLRASAQPFIDGRRAMPAPGTGRGSGRMAPVLAGYASLLGELATLAGPDRAEHVDQHFRVAQVIRQAHIQRSLGEGSARAGVRAESLGVLVDALDERRHEMIAIVGALDRRRLLAPEEIGAPETGALAERLARARAAHAALEDELDTRFPRHRDLLRPRPVGTGEAQRLMRPGEALVAFQVTAGQSWAWAIPQSGPIEYAALGVDGETLAAWVGALRSALAPGPVERPEAIPAYDVESALALFRALFSPVAPGWRTGSHLMIVPDGALAQLAVAALPTDVPTRFSPDAGLRFAEYRRVNWLGHEHALSTLPVVGDLRTIDRAPGVATGGGLLAAYADPVFAPPPDPDDLPWAGAAPAAPPPIPPVYLRASIDTRSLARATLADLPPLPDGARVARALATQLQVGAENLFLAERASESNVRQRDLSRKQVLLFATHVLAPGDLDGLVQPALALSNPAIARGGGDGLLELDEILALDLDADLVVLSELDTGGGGGRTGDAAAALVRAFLHANTRALLTSHWPASPGATIALFRTMWELDEDELGRSRAEVLQLSMSRLAATGVAGDAAAGTAYSLAHPVFWAAFSIQGDGRRTMR